MLRNRFAESPAASGERSAQNQVQKSGIPSCFLRPTRKNASLGAGGQNGSLNPLYQIGGPRSPQLAPMLINLRNTRKTGRVRAATGMCVPSVSWPRGTAPFALLTANAFC